MEAAIEDEFYIQILLLRKEHMETYACMETNEAQGTRSLRAISSLPMLLPKACPSFQVIPALGFTEAKGLI